MKLIILTLLSFILFSCGSQNNSINETDSQPIQTYQSDALRHMSLTELRLVRNEIFARHGYIFKNRDLANYFSTKDWYEAKYMNVDSLLTDADKKNIKLILDAEKEIKNNSIPIDEQLLDKYSKLDTIKFRDHFLSKLFATIDQFKNKMADTIIYTIANVDGAENIDTVKTRIFYMNDTVYVQSSWMRNNELIWSDVLMDPYIWISDNDLFHYDTRSNWITFTTALYYALPEFNDISNYSNIDKELSISMGMDWIRNNKVILSEKNYRDYFNNFKGQVMEYGMPENSQLYIWCEPVSDFILFYRP